MGASRALLDGRPLLGSVTWELKGGTAPFRTVVRMRRSDADALVGASAPLSAVTGGSYPSTQIRPVTLTLEAGGRKTTIQQVYVLHRVASDSPKYAAVEIADQRWLWPRIAYRRVMNRPRRVGTKRLTSPNQLDPTNLEPALVYARWSLQDGTQPWTAGALVRDLAAALRSWITAEVPGASFQTTVPSDIAAVEQSPIQDLELVGGMDEVIGSALSYLPGVDVTVDADGAVRFFRRSDGTEADAVSSAGRETQSGGHIEAVGLGGYRPRKVRVFFSVEAELRADAQELEVGSTTDVNDSTTIVAENVLQVTDPSITVNGQTCYTGMWVRLSDAFTAWGNLPVYGTPLTFAIVRRAMVPFNSLWQRINYSGQASPSADWMARIGSVATHFRRTYKIKPQWMDAIAEIRPYRIATINTETGSRGTATVWSDFAYLASERSWYAEANNNSAISYAMNVACYPSSGLISSSTIAAPATFEVVDSDQGIFRVTYNADPTRQFEQALPSQIELEGTNTSPGTPVPAESAGPSPYLRFSNRPIAWNVLGQFQRPATLTAQHKLIAVFTAIPASPNSKRAMCWVDVGPSDVPGFKGASDCRGPMQEVIVGPGLETARIAWMDAEKTRILSLFSSTADQPVGQDERYPLADLVVNYEGNAQGGASLRAIAVAEAARIYHQSRDRAMGAATFGLHADARVTGAVDRVRHTMSGGVLLTRYELQAQAQPLGLMRFLPASVRKIIGRLVG